MVGNGAVTARRAVLVTIVVLLLPTVVAGVTQGLAGTEGPVDTPANHSVENLSIITAQGRSPDVVDDPGGVEIVKTGSKERVWAHGDPRCIRYYDSEPVDNSTLLLTMNCRVDEGFRVRIAMEHNWRTNETKRIFAIPPDAHDVDKLGPHRYAVADIAEQRAYVYNYTDNAAVDWATFRGQAVRGSTNQEHEWEYNFTDHYPERAGGEEGYGGDWTHLNDVDSVDNESAFLLSPRDFNRVVLVNRSTKRVEWTLGEQTDTSILKGQHHPALLSREPPTVLVGDSLNHRVVEYSRVEPGTEGDDDGDGWVRTWTFIAFRDGGLNWPRDVHRLPNGNTLVMDTGNDRALEVAPNGTVVWEYETMANPFDIDRYAHGDQPRGPTMQEIRGTAPAEQSNASADVSPVERYHRLAGFVLPTWVGERAFVGLVGAVVLAVGWGLTETGLFLRRRVGGNRRSRRGETE